MMQQGSGGYVQNFKSICQKIKIFILGVFFGRWGRWGAVEIGGMLIMRGVKDPLLGGGLHVTCDAHFRTWPSYSREKSRENLVRIS